MMTAMCMHDMKIGIVRETLSHVLAREEREEMHVMKDSHIECKQKS